jgi:hypothetical protein
MGESSPGETGDGCGNWERALRRCREWL